MAETQDTTATVDRLGLEVLAPDECWQLVAQAPVGRLAFDLEGGPMILPVVHGVVGRRIAFRSATGGKLSAIRMEGPVAFEVDAWDAERRTGWSVVARGTARTAPEDADVLDSLPVDTWLAPAGWGTWIEIRVDEISGRRLERPAR